MGTQSMDDNWAEIVRAFWFEELEPKQWFETSRDLDRTIVDRFAKLHGTLKTSLPAEAWSDARSALAAIVVLDQFSRNMYRGTPEAFATDSIACALARNAVEKGLDMELTRDERRFIYMPLMHSEILADQDRCVSLFKSLEDEHSLKYAIEHRDIIARFGRFPHRNRTLGRTNTPEEDSFLKDANTYGQ